MHQAQIYWQTLGLASTLRSAAAGSVTCIVHDLPVNVHQELCRKADARFVKSVANNGGTCSRHYTFENGGYAIMDGVYVGAIECVVTLFEANPYV